MVSTSFRAAGSVVVISAFTVAGVHAATSQGRFAIEGAGLATTSVGDVYSQDLISVGPDKELEEALRLMARHQVRRLPVVENGRLVGIVAQADIALTLSEDEKKTGELVEAISKRSDGERS